MGLWVVIIEEESGGEKDPAYIAFESVGYLGARARVAYDTLSTDRIIILI